MTRFEYEPGCNCSDRLTSVTDGLGRVTRHSYDALSPAGLDDRPFGRETTFAYDVRRAS